MVYPLKFYGGGTPARTTCIDAPPFIPAYLKCNNNVTLFNELTFVSNASGRAIAPEWVQCVSESSVCQGACYDFCELSVYRQYDHKLMIAQRKDPTACQVSGKAEFMHGCVKQCMRDKCNKNCARCKTDWGGGALKCAKSVVDACPDDLAAGMKFYVRYRSSNETEERCACKDTKTSCLDGRAYNDPSLSSDIFPAGKDGKPAQMSTRGEMWHPRDAPREMLLVGLKRLVCHDATCDTYKTVQCMICDKAIAESNKGRALKSDSSDPEKWLKIAAACVKDSIDEEGSVVAAKNCSKANIKAADADFTDRMAVRVLATIAMEGKIF